MTALLWPQILESARNGGDTAPSGHGSTLFVSNLPYTATSVDLQTLFSDIAPIRSAFVVLEPETQVSKGVGYVSFAIKEDAQSAFDTISKTGLTLVGRSLRVQWADSKPKEKGETVKKESKTRPPPRPHVPRVLHDPLAIRTIIRKYDGAESVSWPVKTDGGDEDPGIAHVLFSSAGSASDAVQKLHAHVFKGCLLSVTLKKRLDTLAKPVTKPIKREGGPPDSINSKSAVAPSHASRLIVRNLPFNATEQDLRAVFLPHGPIHSIHIPTSEPAASEGPAVPSTSKVRTKGFAFVWMLSRKDAEKAIEACNGTVVRAGAAETLVTDKQKRKKQRRVEKKLKGLIPPETDPVEELSDEEDVVGDKRATERVIAVDWALSKEKWQEEKAKIEDVAMEPGEAETSSDESESENGNLGVHDPDEDSSEAEGSGDERRDNSETPVKPQLPPPETGTTLFVRNVPFSATEDDMRTLFRAFGPLRYARITLDHSTGRSRGTGFACFWNKEDADKVVEQSDLLRLETTGSEVPKKNPFTLPSILTPDPSSSLAQSLVLHGRTLDVVRAVTRDEAGKLKEAGEKQREKADKRNMYLLREGVILPNTPAAATLTPTEIERRTASFNARRTLLKTNPSLFISKTRLSVRQIPLFATERLLKRLAIHAVRAFEEDVKSERRIGLSADELADTTEEVAEDAAHGDPKGRKKTTGRKTGVKQAKIVRQQERVDPVTGKGRSKGYGFVEMQKHPDALRVIRWANNNSDVGPMFEEWDEARLKRLKDELEKGSTKKPKGTLIVEFSIENIQVIQRRNAIQKDSALKPESKSSEKRPPKKSSEEKAAKKPRLVNEATEIPKEPGKKHSGIGSLIGRKRKERKGTRKAGQ
ncbi:hypothetical protein BD779DRAFT_1544163 [Infundibulicybe gibba]|nr:hypothetical protein BD779DRAFT_1544163 [Infundibulicybe gibba]